MTGDPSPASAIRCSFCDKPQQDVRKLIAGPSVYICNECVDLCHELVAEDSPAPPPSPAPIDLGQRVAGQPAARRAVEAALRLRGLRPGERAPRLLLVGPSGCGKSTFGRAIDEAAPGSCFCVPIDPTTRSIERDLFNGLLKRHRGAPGQAGPIVFLDGLESLADDRPAGERRQGLSAPTLGWLLNLLGGGSTRLPYWLEDLPTKDPAFCSDATTIIATARLGAEHVQRAGSERVLRAALQQAGMLPELLARFDRVVPLFPLRTDDLLLALWAPWGPARWARESIEAAGGTFELTDQAASLLASAAEALPEGAWALRRPLCLFVEEVLVAPRPAAHWSLDEAEARRLLAE